MSFSSYFSLHSSLSLFITTSPSLYISISLNLSVSLHAASPLPPLPLYPILSSPSYNLSLSSFPFLRRILRPLPASRAPQSIASALARIETCIIEVAAWMAINDLQLNAEKSQAILFQPLKHGVNKQPEVCVEFAGRRIALSTIVRNLGVVFDSRLSMEEQVAQTAKSCYYQLRNIGQIRSSITEGACRTLVHALVTSRLDYGNGLLYGIPQATLQRLQRIQNCAARLIIRTPKYEHITPVLRRLYLLPVRQRTLFKLLVLTYSLHLTT